MAINVLAAGDRPGSGGRLGVSIHTPKASELIASYLRRKIVRGELKPRDTLPAEPELMAQFNVSRPTLREAFRILETENLLTIRRGAGSTAEVTAPDISVAARYVGLLLQMQGTTIQDVSTARMVIEPACAGLLARRRTEQDIEDLRAVVAELRAATAPDGVPEAEIWSRLSYRSHELVIERCGNRTLALQMAMLQDIVTRHLKAGISGGPSEPTSPASFRQQLRSLDKLIKLVEARDSAGAESHWRAHIEAAAKSMSRMVPMDRQVVDLFS